MTTPAEHGQRMILEMTEAGDELVHQPGEEPEIFIPARELGEHIASWVGNRSRPLPYGWITHTDRRDANLPWQQTAVHITRRGDLSGSQQWLARRLIPAPGATSTSGTETPFLTGDIVTQLFGRPGSRPERKMGGFYGAGAGLVATMPLYAVDVISALVALPVMAVSAGAGVTAPAALRRHAHNQELVRTASRTERRFDELGWIALVCAALAGRAIFHRAAHGAPLPDELASVLPIVHDALWELCDPTHQVTVEHCTGHTTKIAFQLIMLLYAIEDLDQVLDQRERSLTPVSGIHTPPLASRRGPDAASGLDDILTDTADGPDSIVAVVSVPNVHNDPALDHARDTVETVTRLYTNTDH